MAGLLDFLNTDDGKLGVALLAAAGPSATPMSFGQRLQGAMQNMQAQREEELRRGLLSMQFDAAKRNAEDEKAARETATRFYTPAQVGMGQMESQLPPELRTGAAPVSAQPAKFDMQGYAQARMAQNPIAGLQLMTALQKETPFNKVDPKDYTPESVARFAQSRSYGDLVPRNKMEVAPGGQVYDPYGIKPGQFLSDPNKPFAAGPNGPVPNTPFQQYEITKAGVSAPRVNVNTDKSYFGNVAESLAKSDAALIDAARSAPDRIASARRVREILQTNPITGTGAELRTNMARALATAGLIDGKDVANTEVLASTLASQTLDAIKTSGLGAGQGFTDKDRQFLERARSGNIEMTPQALNQLATLNERAAIASIRRGNEVIETLRNSPEAGRFGSQLKPVQEPPVSKPAPSGQAMSSMPPANASNKGRTLLDQQTGIRYRSNGMQWEAIPQ